MKKNLFTFLLLFALKSSAMGQDKKYIFYADKMGSPYTTTIFSKDSAEAISLYHQSILIVDSLVRIISDYDSTSELNTLNAVAGKKALPISPFLEQLLMEGKKAYVQTNGTYTIAIGPLSRLWRVARKTKVFPSATEVEKAKKYINANDIMVDTTKHIAKLRHPGMQIDLGSLGKGAIAQYVVNFFKQKGIDNCMVDAGGKVVCSKADTDTGYWKIGMSLPGVSQYNQEQIIVVKNKAIASSGDQFQFFNQKGVRYSHIINPFTGYGITTLKNVTAIANDGMVADWLATACSLLSIEKALQLAKQYHAELYIAVKKGEQISIYKTKGFEAYFKNNIY